MFFSEIGGHNLQQGTVERSLEDCKKKCLDNPKCTAIDYTPSKGYCYLNGDYTEGDVDNESTSQLVQLHCCAL